MNLPQPPVSMPVECRVRVSLNGSELLTLQMTPDALDDWTVGFLQSEGVIDGPADLLALRVDANAGAVDAHVSPDRAAVVLEASARYLTSGCGKGVTFSSVKDAMLLRPVTHALTVTQGQLLAWTRRLQAESPQYAKTGGMHAAGVVHVPTETLVVREDIGRHNAVDKAIGAALKAGWDPAEAVVLTTGRISYEMCTKLARYGAGVGASLTAATDQAIRLAERLGIDLLGYVRKPDKVELYTRGARIRPD
ncbi:MAG: formate dehydrogenase associated protein [Symbiobacteriaceae bacterium]|jgi:FdhD protein|nr:formate dehydrogenase associated protein [Symbiobacteriaceae bacterium]